jgi:hypothetical protein
VVTGVGEDGEEGLEGGLWRCWAVRHSAVKRHRPWTAEGGSMAAAAGEVTKI